MVSTAPKNEYQNYNNLSFYDYLEQQKPKLLAFNVTTRIFEKGTYIYQPPTNTGYIYEIVQGAVKLGSYTVGGNEFVHDIIYSGDYFGNLKYLNNQFHEFSKTLVSSKIRIYKLSFFKNQIPNDPFLAEWFMTYLVKRWCASEKKIKIIKEKDAALKLDYLSAFFDITFQDARHQSHHLYNILTQQELGDIAGVSRQTISQAQKS